MIEAGISPIFDASTTVPRMVSPNANANVNVAGSSSAASSSASSVTRLDLSDMRRFLSSPLPRGSSSGPTSGFTFQCYILRNKKGLKNKLFPTYEVYISGEEKFLMAARKRTKNKTSNYMISLDKNNPDGSSSSSSSKDSSSSSSSSYLGKVRSNFVGTQFVTYDQGVNPKDLPQEELNHAANHNTLSPSSSSSSSSSSSPIRAELAAVFYESNILGNKGPRKMTAVIPNISGGGGGGGGGGGNNGGNNNNAIWRPLSDKDSILHRYPLSPSSREFYSLTNKTPKWNESVGAYVLNFQGRVTQASVKNFQLVNADGAGAGGATSREDDERVILQFGRIGKDCFTMDFQYPLSPLQAFSICLTSFDYKFACE